MGENEKLTFEIVRALIKLPTDDYLRAKILCFIHAAERKNLKEFLNIVFEVAEKERPLLIGIKVDDNCKINQSVSEIFRENHI